MERFKVIIVEDVPLELKGTEGIFRNEIPEAEIIGTAENERACCDFQCGSGRESCCRCFAFLVFVVIMRNIFHAYDIAFFL